MQEVEEVLRMLSPQGTVSKEGGSKGADGPVVETIESQVTPLEEESGAAQGVTQTEQDNTGNKQENTGGVQSENPEDSKTNNNSEGNLRDSKEDSATEKPQDHSQSDNQAADQETKEQAEEQQAEEQKPGDAQYYIVEPGDTLNTICIKLYQSNKMAKKIKELNKIEDGDKIFAGQKLLLP